jgi:hypothetical protein
VLDWLSRSQNILPQVAPPVWISSDVPGSLQKLREYVEGEAAKAINWYFNSKASKALWSRWLRFLAIALSTVAGVLPIVISVWKGNTSGIESGLLVSLLLGVAAGLIGLDHFFGFSSGWIRYVLTATAIQAALEEFRMDWELLNAHLSMPPSNDQILALLERARAFRTSIAGMVLDETKSWAAEFQTNLSQLEKSVKAEFEQQRTKLEEELKAQKAATRPGGIEVKVSNAITLDDRSFSIWLEGTTPPAQPEVVVGSTVWSEANVAPGQYKLVVKGKRSGADVQASRIIKVASGEVASAEVEMPA